MIEICLCKLAEQEHGKSARQYAHVFHWGNAVICVCEDFFDLPRHNRYAILLHEIGHLFAGTRGGERTANKMIERFYGIEIQYRDTLKYGKRLEWIDPQDFPQAAAIFRGFDIDPQRGARRAA